MNNIKQIDQKFIEEHTVFTELISEIRNNFSTNKVLTPIRHHHDFPNPEVNENSTLFLMPAWNPSKNAGVKIVTVSPISLIYQPFKGLTYILML